MKDFFRGLSWVVFLLVLIVIVIGVLGQLNGRDMDMYLQAQRINNG